jgi:hypothetical protein
MDRSQLWAVRVAVVSRAVAIWFNSMLRAESVDILCIGSGGVGLAAGIAGADAGLKVFVAESNREATAPRQGVASSVESWTTVLQRRWGIEEFSTSTADYLKELTTSLDPPAPVKTSGHIPMDTVETFDGVSVDPGKAVPPFHGTELAAWSRECLTSPFALISSRVSTWALTPMRKVDGHTVTAGLIASVPTTRRRETTIHQWLSDLAREKGVLVQESCSVQDLLFDEGHLVGAVLDTPDGMRTVSARRGVVLGTSTSAWDQSLPMSTNGGTALCVVGRTASRFARLEFLVNASSYDMNADRGCLA